MLAQLLALQAHPSHQDSLGESCQVVGIDADALVIAGLAGGKIVMPCLLVIAEGCLAAVQGVADLFRAAAENWESALTQVELVLGVELAAATCPAGVSPSVPGT